MPIEAVVVKLLKEHLVTKQDRSTTSNVLSEDRGTVAQLVAGIVVYEDRLVVRLKSENGDEPSDSRMIGRSQVPGRNHHPKDPARSCSRIMHLEAIMDLEAKSVRNSSSAGRVWSAQSREVVGGWMTLSPVE